MRLETGAVEFEISNRVQNVQQPTEPHEVRLFARAQVDVNLSLGQLIRNAMFEEAEPEFQQYAFFNTRICKLLLNILSLTYVLISLYN